MHKKIRIIKLSIKLCSYKHSNFMNNYIHCTNTQIWSKIKLFLVSCLTSSNSRILWEKLLLLTGLDIIIVHPDQGISEVPQIPRTPFRIRTNAAKFDIIIVHPCQKIDMGSKFKVFRILKGRGNWNFKKRNFAQGGL